MSCNRSHCYTNADSCLRGCEQKFPQRDSYDRVNCDVVCHNIKEACLRRPCFATPNNTGTAQKRMQYASTAAQKQNGWRSAAQDSTEPQSYGGCARCKGYPLQPVDRRPCPGSKPGPKPLPQDYFRPLRSRSYFDVWNK